MKKVVKCCNYDDINCYYLAGREKGQIKADTIIYRNGNVHQVINRLICFMQNNQRKQDRFSTKTIVNMIIEKNVDLIHLHNIHGNYMGLRDIEEISKYCKIVWTLHDMWAMTGHCAFSCQCFKWATDSCRCCSNLDYYPKIRIDIAECLYKIKKNTFIGKNIFFVVPSKWMMKQCEQSFLGQEKKTLIHNGVNTTLFYPIDKEKLRKKYNISQNKIVLMFAANNIGNIYKGAGILEKALSSVKEKGAYELVIVGNTRPLSFSKDYVCHYMGYVLSDERMNELYSLSDVFILSSRAENFPCTIIESMASGTPVIASNVGGISEQVDDKTGWLFDIRYPKQLTEIIDNIINDKDKLYMMGINCRRKIEECFSEKKMIEEYKNLYDNVIH